MSLKGLSEQRVIRSSCSSPMHLPSRPHLTDWYRLCVLFLCHGLLSRKKHDNCGNPFNNLELIWTYNTCNLQFTKTLVFTNAKKPTAAWWACMFVVTFASKKCGSTTPFLSGHSFLKSGGALDYSPSQIRISHTQETTHSKQHCLLLEKAVPGVNQCSNTTHKS